MIKKEITYAEEVFNQGRNREEEDKVKPRNRRKIYQLAVQRKRTDDSSGKDTNRMP